LVLHPSGANGTTEDSKDRRGIVIVSVFALAFGDVISTIGNAQDIAKNESSLTGGFIGVACGAGSIVLGANLHDGPDDGMGRLFLIGGAVTFLTGVAAIWRAPKATERRVTPTVNVGSDARIAAGFRVRF
jgi:hypothetical protein